MNKSLIDNWIYRNSSLTSLACKIYDETTRKGMIRFNPLTVKDRPLVHEWLVQPHIADWIHGIGLQNTLNGLERFFQEESITTYWIGYDKDSSFAFLITAPEGNDATTLDLFICDSNYLGKGIAVPMEQELLGLQQ